MSRGRKFWISGLLGFLSLSVVSFFASAQQTESVQGPKISWESSTHDFGDINQGDRVEKTFTFTNTGNEPLIITNVQVSCGCTLPKNWPRDPVSPGNKGELTVAFNSAGKFGKQNKVVTIVSNSVNKDGSQLLFSANVIEKK
ncbi:MAG: DUF1573 domain-containing protein [Flammeovirgaceae bacterium]|nr:DUF1573 domain-containing protein [Flammeovirgaceae bacterium]